MPFTKYCEGPMEATGARYHYLAACGTKLHLFGRKGVNLPKHSWFHRTILNGGATFEIDYASKATKLITFPEIDIDEDCEDHVFTLDGVAYLLTYCHYDCIKFRDLYSWDEKANQWKSEGKFNVDDRCNVVEPGKNDVIFYTDRPNRRVIIGFLTGSDEKKINIFAMSLDGRKVYLLATAGIGMQPVGCSLTHLALLSKEVAIVITGCDMCGFWWQPERPITVDLSRKQSQTLQASGDSIFGYSGSRYAFMSPGGNWVHMIGSVASGESDSEDVSDIVVFSPATKQWAKSPIKLPLDLNIEEAYADCSAAHSVSKVFVGDTKSVYEIDTAEFDN